MYQQQYIFSLLRENNTELRLKFEAETLHYIIEQFELFLKGAGFVFDGHMIDIVPIESDDLTQNEEDLNVDYVKEVQAWFADSPQFSSFKSERTTNAE